VTVALDDSACVRAGRKVHGTGWQHDGSARNPQKLSFGNCFVTAGIVVALPFSSRTWCLPVLARLHLPGKGAGPSRPPWPRNSSRCWPARCPAGG